MAEVRDAIAVLRERFNKVVSENGLSVHDVAKQADIESHDVIDFQLGGGRDTNLPAIVDIERWVDWASA